MHVYCLADIKDLCSAYMLTVFVFRYRKQLLCGEWIDSLNTEYMNVLCVFVSNGIEHTPRHLMENYGLFILW